jgi:putative ABC transport system permease protein
MNDRSLMWKNLWRKPVRTILLLITITIGFAILATTLSFNRAATDFNTKPTRMVTLSKINFTETLPIAHYDRIAHTEGVAAATHINWFGGYYREPQNFLVVFAIDPQTYFQVYGDDLQGVSPAQREQFFHERTGMLVPESLAQHWGWRVGQRIPLKSNIFTNRNTGDSTWEFTLVGTFPTPQGSSQTGTILMHYEYFNETITFGRDRVGWVPFLTTSSTLNNQVAHAIDARFANSADETSTQDEAAFNASFAAQRGNMALVISLVVGAAFIAILLIVGTTMALAVRERTKEVGVLKTLGFSSGRVLRMVLGESLLLSLLGAALGVAGAWGMLRVMSKFTEGSGFGFGLSTEAVVWSAIVAITLALVTGFAPAFSAYRLKIIDALGRR